MRVATIQLLFILVWSLPTRALNPAWIKEDKRIIAEVNALLTTTPATIEHYFTRQSIRQGHTLGFGWSSRETAVYGGYTSIYATFYYRNGRLVSYVIHPALPDKPALQPTYRMWYAPSFRRQPTHLNSVYFNKTALSQPLPAYSNLAAPSVTTKAMQDYMSPESDVVYGYAGGESLQILPNRAAFLALRPTLVPEQIVYLMYAINPASRLTAFEFYLQNKALFTHQNQQAIEQWMEQVFRALPEVESISGCIGGKYEVRALMDFTTTP